MNKRPNVASEIEALASEVREGDGVDPRDEVKRKRHRVPSALPGEGSHFIFRPVSQKEVLGGDLDRQTRASFLIVRSAFRACFLPVR
jgi:hypothetical protein